jgi:hypothetical protein
MTKLINSMNEEIRDSKIINIGSYVTNDVYASMMIGEHEPPFARKFDSKHTN